MFSLLPTGLLGHLSLHTPHSTPQPERWYCSNIKLSHLDFGEGTVSLNLQEFFLAYTNYTYSLLCYLMNIDLGFDRNNTYFLYILYIYRYHTYMFRLY